MQDSTLTAIRLAIFLPSLSGGGAERVMVTLANGFAKMGYTVDLVLSAAQGPYLSEVSPQVRIVNLKHRRAWFALPALARYLRAYQPISLLAAMGHANVLSVLAKRLAKVPTRIIVSERNSFSQSHRNAANWRVRFLLPRLMAWTYPRADGVIAVSHGVADDLALSLQLPRSLIQVVYNPVVAEHMLAKSQLEPVHLWLKSKQQAVIVGMGRLAKQKDFPTLLRAFALLQQKQDVRLIIFGQGVLRAELMALAEAHGLQDHVDFPGFVANPFAELRHADLFVLSSAWEGLPNVLIQAMACGVPVVATDCPSGPAEILEAGKWGRLVPVADVAALAKAMAAALADHSPPDVTQRAAQFSVDQGVRAYLNIMLPDA